MKLLLDQNISYKVVRYLNEKVPELTHVKFVGLLNAEDNEIWKFARTLIMSSLPLMPIFMNCKP